MSILAACLFLPFVFSRRGGDVEARNAVASAAAGACHETDSRRARWVARNHVEQLHVTGYHKLFSRSHEARRSVADLSVGETISGLSGDLTVKSLAHIPGTHRVYNMTVEGEHVFHVSQLGVLAHNNNCHGPPFVSSDDLAKSGEKLKGPRKLSDRATKELPPGQTRTPQETRQARDYYKNHKDEAKRQWPERNGGKEWPDGATPLPGLGEMPALVATCLLRDKISEASANPVSRSSRLWLGAR